MKTNWKGIDLAERYKELLNRVIEDYSKGIRNVKLKEEMKEIEEEFGKRERFLK
jgi:hypothetical protein